MARYTCIIDVDLPDGTSAVDAEAYIAFGVAAYFASKGLPGNCAVTCKGIDPTKDVLTATPTQDIPDLSLAAATEP